MHIREMAARLAITPRAIRFYEEKGLIAPAKEESSGYRQFAEEDAWRLQTIVALREVGMPIDQIRRVLEQLDNEGGGGSLLPYLEVQRAYMYDRWLELKAVIQTTETMIDRLRRDSRPDPSVLYTLAEANKRLRQTRSEWVDRWNFNQLADVYDELVINGGEGFNPHHGYEQVLDEVVAAAAPKPGETGLDAATGTGNLAKRFEGRGVTVCAIDQSMEMLKRCKQKNPRVETKLGNLLAIPYLDRTFDFVVTSYALHHLTDEQKKLAMAEFERVLKPGGRMVIADLMFADEAARQAHLEELRRRHQEQAVAAIADEYYADRSALIDALRRLGFTVEARQLTTYVHLIKAVRSQRG